MEKLDRIRTILDEFTLSDEGRSFERLATIEAIRRVVIDMKTPCPVCSHLLETDLEVIGGSRYPGIFSATIRCRGCESSIGLPEVSVVYRGDGPLPCKQCLKPSDPNSFFEDPDGIGTPIPLCPICKVWAEELCTTLRENPKFMAEFETAVSEAEGPKN